MPHATKGSRWPFVVLDPEQSAKHYLNDNDNWLHTANTVTPLSRMTNTLSIRIQPFSEVCLNNT